MLFIKVVLNQKKPKKPILKLIINNTLKKSIINFQTIDTSY